MYSRVKAKNPNTTNIIIPMTTEVRYLLNRVCQQWNTGITTLFTNASLTKTSRPNNVVQLKCKVFMSLDPKKYDKWIMAPSDISSRPLEVSKTNCVHYFNSSRNFSHIKPHYKTTQHLNRHHLTLIDNIVRRWLSHFIILQNHLTQYYENVCDANDD